MILSDDIQLYQFLDYFDKSELVRYGRCSKHMLELINQYDYLKIKRCVGPCTKYGIRDQEGPRRKV